MDTTHIREFLVLAKNLSYTATADELYVSQPTLSRHIITLEEELGTRLFERTKSSVTLTPSGVLAQESLGVIVAKTDELLRHIDRITKDSLDDLRLGMVYYGISTFYGYPLLKAFGVRYPEVRVSTITGQTAQILEHLKTDRIDVALSTTSIFTTDDALKQIIMAKIPLYAIMQSSHPLANSDTVSPETLSKQRIILDPTLVGKTNHVEATFTRLGLDIQDIVYTEHIDALLHTMDTIGGIFIGSMLLSAMPQQNLIFVPIESSEFFIDVSLIYLKRNASPSIDKLVDCIGDIRMPRM